MRMILLSLPVNLIEFLDASQNRSERLREILRAGLALGLTGHRRNRNTLGPCKNTTLFVDDELYAQMKNKVVRGGRNGFIEESLTHAIAMEKHD